MSSSSAYLLQSHCLVSPAADVWDVTQATTLDPVQQRNIQQRQKKTTYLNLTLLPTDRQTDLQCLRTFRWWFWLWLWGGQIHSHSSWVSDLLQSHTSHFSLNHSSGVYQCSALRYLAHMKMLSGNLFWLYLKISSDHRHTQLLNISAGGFTVGLLTYCVLWRSRIIQTDWFTVKVTVCGACGQQMIQLHYSRVPDRWNH